MFKQFNTLFKIFNEHFNLNKKQDAIMIYSITELFNEGELMELNNKIAIHNHNPKAIIRKVKEIQCVHELLNLYIKNDIELYATIDTNGDVLTSYYPTYLMTYDTEQIAKYIKSTGDGYDILNNRNKYYIEEFISYAEAFIQQNHLAVNEDYKSIFEKMVQEKYAKRLVAESWQDLMKIFLADFFLND